MRHPGRIWHHDGIQSSVRARVRACARYPLRYIPVVLLCAIVVALITATATATEAQDDAIDIQKRDLAEMEGRAKDLETDLNTSRGRRTDLVTELERHERHIADLARAGHQLEQMVGEQEGALEELRSQLAAEQDAMHRERTALGNLLRSAYATSPGAMGRGDRIRILLNQEDPGRLSRALSYYGILNRHRQTRIEAIAQRAHRLERLLRATEEEKARLFLLAAKQDETRARLTAAQGDRAALLASLDRSIATGEQRMEELRAQTREMRLLLEQLERKALELPEAELHQESLRQRRGHLTWPLAGSTLLARYGSPKGDGAQHWDGVVLAAEEGTRVRAVHHGRIAYADWLRGFGLLLIIEHDDDYMTLYGHNQTLLKEPGEWVASGDTVALSGSSGGQAAAGLYFAIRHRGRPLNPEQWCRRSSAGRGIESSAAGAGTPERIPVSSLQSGEPGLLRAFPSFAAAPVSDSRYQ